MKILASITALLMLCSCSDVQGFNEFVPSRHDLSQQEYDAERAAYKERNREWDNVIPMLVLIFATAALMNSNGGGITPHHPP